MSYAATPALVRLPIWRARIVLFAFVGAFAVLLGRSVWLQAVKTGFLQERGEARYSRVLEVPATRGRILDRRGDALAISTPVKSIWAIPEDFRASPAQLRQLGRLLDAEPRELNRKLNGSARDFVYLKRQIPPETAERVAELGIPGLYQQREFRRYYPSGETMAHVVGFTGVDDTGQEGIELAFQGSLAGAPGSRRVIKDRLGHVVEDIESIRAAQDGKDLRLALDGKIQSLAFAALKQAVDAHKAKGGALVAIDARSGEVLALANVPTYNPNNRARMIGAQLRNRVITDLFEPGSTLKPFTIALALELGKVTPDTVIQTAPGRLTIANYTIHDAHPGGAMSVAQVIQKSSNVGAAKIALSLPREEMRELFRRVGFGAQPQLGFPGEAAGKVREARTWRPIEQATMAYGHGISVSLVQLARAYTALARDGELLPLSLVKTEMPVAGRRVLSAETARALRAMLEAATQPGGTALRARIMGWRVAGKTGTAHKLEHGGYAAHKYIASFVGFAPVSAPRLVVAVMIDEPAAGQYYGGAVAAPVFAQVMQGALRLLQVPHDAPLTPVELPGEGEEAREST
ncbi:MAG: cell division protein [Betaproteobacteria bacterium RIFCSPLOWO2_02_FULL_67_19]|nr:MAG: cell division protein [Betaproteobacteria bacterium RIFCSPLOWO2_02_FULL_67_19]